LPSPALPFFDLSGRVAVVTGGNRGIGLGLATGLAKAGASLALWARDAARSEEAAETLRAHGGRVEPFACDVSSEESVVAATRETVERLGRVDIGVANAGFGAAGNLLEMPLDEWRRILATNLDGAFLTFRELGRHMKERGGGGKLIAISSISAKSGTPLQPHYAASKGGLEAMVRSFAVRLARYDVQVNAVEPGWIVTEATQGAVENEGFSDIVMRRTPARRWGTPEDFEGIAVYLASDASRYHTGDVIRIDGGYWIF
jgi:NAD(P)-dependent dehydrogenase (short-subunit alcohol dehydrogenase family)